MMNPSTAKITTPPVVRPTETLPVGSSLTRGPVPAILAEKQVPAKQAAPSAPRNLLNDRHLRAGSGACIAYVPMGWMFRFDRERDDFFGRRSD